MINYGHRGACAYAPENTLLSFYMAQGMGVNGLETDVRRTKDGHLVLFHDQALRRIVDVEGGIADYNLDELTRMDFGAYKGEEFRGEPIALFSDFLRCFGRKPLELAVEIKAPGIAREALAQIENNGCAAHVIITAFELENLIEVRKLDQHIRLGWLVSAVDEDTWHNLRANKIGQICPHSELIDDAMMDRALVEGLTVRAWGVKTPTIMESLLAFDDLYGMTVDFPDKLAACLKNQTNG